MKETDYSQKFLRRRKMLLVMPVLVLPFVTLAFWALGGGKGADERAAGLTVTQGLNPKLPDPKLKNDKGLTKMSYYEMAQSDSEKFKVRLRNDPFFTLKPSDSSDESADGALAMAFDGGATNRKEAAVYDRLKQINEAMENAKKRPENSTATDFREQLHNSADSRVTDPVRPLPKVERGVDSDMLQINAMLDKVMDIQHPERVNERQKQYPGVQDRMVMRVLANNNANGFFSESGLEGMDSLGMESNAMEAVVHETQSLVNGSYVKMRLLTDVHIRNRLIPKDQFVYGKVTLTGERLEIAVSAIRYGAQILPVDLSVYDMDGIAGIYIPGSMTRDVAKQSSGNTLQSVSLNSLDPSIGAQALGAGIETAKTLINKKIKLVRVTVKAGYRVLLRNANVQ